MELKVIERAKLRKRQREHEAKVQAEEVIRLRGELERDQMTISELQKEVERLKAMEEEYSKLISWSVEAENKIEALTCAINEL